jgi:hypothetical protein
MNGLDLLGADVEAAAPKKPITLGRGVVAVAAGALGALAWPAHRTLGFLNAAALASNTHAVVTGDRSWKDGVKRMGRHIVASAGSLALPNHPAIGYVAGAIAADLLIDGDGGGIIEEWARYEDVIDGEVVESKPTAAIVKTS